MAINFKPDNNYEWGGMTPAMTRASYAGARHASERAAPQPPTQVDKDAPGFSLPPANPVGPMPYTSQGELPPLGGGFRPVQPPSPITPDQPAGEPVDISTQQFPTQF